jgi:hypothetical protein
LVTILINKIIDWVILLIFSLFQRFKDSNVQGSKVQGSKVQGSKVQGSKVQGSKVQII